MRDFLEYLEDGAEARLDEMTEGLPAGKFRCFCRKVADLDSAMPAGPSPYASPICPDCFEEEVKKQKEKPNV
jgi:hypothetical protein